MHINTYMQASEACSQCSDSGSPILPCIVTFAEVDAPISTIRLAAFTGSRFFRSALQHTAQLEDRECSISSGRAQVEVAEVSPDTLNVLLRVIEGSAPAELSLRQAGELIGAMEYCMACQPLMHMVLGSLEPLVQQLKPLEVCPSTPPV